MTSSMTVILSLNSRRQSHSRHVGFGVEQNIRCTQYRLSVLVSLFSMHLNRLSSRDITARRTMAPEDDDLDSREGHKTLHCRDQAATPYMLSQLSMKARRLDGRKQHPFSTCSAAMRRPHLSNKSRRDGSSDCRSQQCMRPTWRSCACEGLHTREMGHPDYLI
jgi:hypothetical protein